MLRIHIQRLILKMLKQYRENSHNFKSKFKCEIICNSLYHIDVFLNIIQKQIIGTVEQQCIILIICYKIIRKNDETQLYVYFRNFNKK